MTEPTASAAALARLRRMVNEPDDGNGWTDIRLDDILQESVGTNGAYDFNSSAADVWEAKSAETTALTDVTESSSSRRNSQYFDHCLKMVALYRGKAADEAAASISTRPKSEAIARPTRA